MMHEDKLTHDERLRLECLAQAIANHAMLNSPSPSQLVREAQEYERYIKGDET